jgi:hypothetical protein
VQKTNTFNIGWLYLFCGLILTVSAIVLPAHKDLQVLESKKVTIASNAQDLETRIGVYSTFLQEVNTHNPFVKQRLIEMQFNETPNGTAVVIDKSAPATPLAWVAQRAKKEKNLPMESEHASMLSIFVAGQGRLWVLGIGVFLIFIGLISSNSAMANE